MRYKSLFRVLVKVIGVWMVATAISVVASRIGTAFYFVSLGTGVGAGPHYFYARYGDNGFIDFVASELSEPTVQLLIGLLLFFRSNWIANLAIPSNRPYCVECGYDLTAHAADKCPECGTAKSKGDGL